jgi:hypothetical protein
VHGGADLEAAARNVFGYRLEERKGKAIEVGDGGGWGGVGVVLCGGRAAPLSMPHLLLIALLPC